MELILKKIKLGHMKLFKGGGISHQVERTNLECLQCTSIVSKIKI